MLQFIWILFNFDAEMLVLLLLQWNRGVVMGT